MAKNPQHTDAGLSKRVTDLEEMWSKLKWASAIIGTAVVIVTGVGFVEIPRRATEEAVKRVTSIVEEEVKKRIPDTIVEEARKQQQAATRAAEETERLRGRVARIAEEAEAMLGALKSGHLSPLVDKLPNKEHIAESDGLIVAFTSGGKPDAAMEILVDGISLGQTNGANDTCTVPVRRNQHYQVVTVDSKGVKGGPATGTTVRFFSFLR